MLSIKHITVEYNNFPTVTDFDLHVKKGEIISLVGESGSGKTTVIRAVLGLLPQEGEITEGDIIYHGSSLLAKSEAEWMELRGSKISMIFQDCGAMLNPIRRIGSQFIESIRVHEKISKKEANEKAVHMLEAMNLPDGENVMHSYPFQLSGGMRQRVGIAMSMVFQPDLLLADEPTSALDVTTQAQIVKQMIQLREKNGTSIILVTHNLGVAAYMSDRIVVMQNGRIVETGTKEAIIQNPQTAYTKKLLTSVPTMEGIDYV